MQSTDAALDALDADVQPADEQEPAPQVVLPPVLLLPDRDDDEMMADAKRIAAEVGWDFLGTLRFVRSINE